MRTNSQLCTKCASPLRHEPALVLSSEVSSTPKSAERTSKIVRAAAQLFARQGYHATNTREIARVAEISENTLFRHFEHKEDVYWAALRSHLAELNLRRELLESIAEGAGPEIVLPQILAQLVDTAILRPELLRLIAVGFVELRWKAIGVFREYFSPIFSSLNRYLASNIENGTVRNLDPAMVMSALAMTVMLHPEFSALIGGAPQVHSDTQKTIQAYAKFWLDVLVIPEFDRVHAAVQSAKACAT